MTTTRYRNKFTLAPVVGDDGEVELFAVKRIIDAFEAVFAERLPGLDGLETVLRTGEGVDGFDARLVVYITATAAFEWLPDHHLEVFAAFRDALSDMGIELVSSNNAAQEMRANPPEGMRPVQLVAGSCELI
jgi:hypothetical protein